MKKDTKLLNQGMKARVYLKNDLGMHARVAGLIFQTARKFKANVYIRKGDQEVSSDSVVEMLTLDCPKGTPLIIRAEGKEARAALESIVSLFEEKFGEN
ncbi:MAG: HPr family phosphocarrier protein [Deltaproteobacteria bacterium]|nr:HPr family phosphocarrier protein [Deltaproteobacteria bacterium]MBW2305885.1 HPr family phosphocarrier protein [Deltaproteobacteria bacterium]